MYRLPLLLFSLLIFSDLYSQEAPKVWTLKECIDHAQKNNLQVRQNELNNELNKSKLQQSVAAVLPSVNGNVSHVYNYGRTIDPYTNQFVDQRTQSNNFSLSSSVPIFEGFQLQNTIRQNSYDYQAGKFDVQKQRNDLSLNVVTAYLQVLYNKELVATSKNQLEVSQSQLERTKKLVESGALARASQLDAESQAATEELKLVNAQNQLDISILTLAQLLDLPSTKGFDIENPNFGMPLENLLNQDPESITEYALKNQPEIKSAEMKVKSAEKSLAIARGGRSPRLLLNASLGTGYSDARERVAGYNIDPTRRVLGFTPDNTPVYSAFPNSSPIMEKTPFRDQLNDNYNKSVGLNLSIPLFNGWQVQNNVQRARINEENNKLSYQIARNNLHKTIQQAYADANAAYKKYNATSKSLESLRENFRYTKQKFDVGLVNALEYLTAKNNQNKAESDLLQAKYDFIFKTKVLDFYLGKPLTF